MGYVINDCCCGCGCGDVTCCDCQLDPASFCETPGTVPKQLDAIWCTDCGNYYFPKLLLWNDFVPQRNCWLGNLQAACMKPFGNPLQCCECLPMQTDVAISLCCPVPGPDNWRLDSVENGTGGEAITATVSCSPFFFAQASGVIYRGFDCGLNPATTMYIFDPASFAGQPPVGNNFSAWEWNGTKWVSIPCSGNCPPPGFNGTQVGQITITEC